MKIIRGENGKHEVIRDAKNICIKAIEDMLDYDAADPDEVFYESSVFGMPYITVEYTYIDPEDGPIEDSLDIEIGDTILFAGERIEFVPEFDDITIPKWKDFCVFVRKFAARLSSNFEVATALRALG